MNRRVVLRVGGMMAMAPVLSVGAAERFTFGVQLSTLTPLMLADFEGTLAKVAEVGYRQVEFSAMGFLGRPVEKIASLLKKYHLTAPVGRVAPQLPANFASLSREEVMQVFRSRAGVEYFLDNVKRCIEEATALGQRHLNLPGWMADRYQTLRLVEENIDLLNQAGDLCAKAGIQFGYHNHSWELQPIDGVIPYDLMLARTDPVKVGFQLDTYWIVKGGGDLTRYITEHPGRIATCHLKDIDDTGQFADVGAGEIDFADFINRARRNGTRYFFVERDGPPKPLLSVRSSYAYLRGLKVS